MDALELAITLQWQGFALIALLDFSPQLRLFPAKQQEARNKESIWHDISLSAGNPHREQVHGYCGVRHPDAPPWSP